MHSRTVAIAFGFLATPIFAQEAKAPPRRSLADGLVRQLIEQEKLQPPRAESGQEVGAGQGPMVLLVRRADGTLTVHEIERGAGDHGPAAEKKTVPVEGKPDEAAKRPGGEAEAVARIRIARSGDELAIGTQATPRAFAGKSVDRERLQPFLKEQFASTQQGRLRGHLILQVEPEVPMQDVLAAWEVARAAGFTMAMFGTPRAIKPLPAADQQLIAGLAGRFGWRVEKLGPQPICDGELLVLLDGPARFEDVAPLLVAFAKAGIWQFGFVGQKDMKTRFKLPTHLPFDRGQ